VNRLCMVFLFGCAVIAPRMILAETPAPIVVGAKASEMERYAAKELQRYLYQISGTLLPIETSVAGGEAATFVIGTRQSNPRIEKLAAAGQLHLTANDPGPQGYVLKSVADGKHATLAIAANDDVGCLYGVYGLLEEHFGVGFSLGGDVLPEAKSSLALPELDERKTPAVAVRGFLPWTNFPQSATVYSWEDWKFILDQMAKMRLNFLHIHNYNGEGGHNEMFHNFTLNGHTSRVWMATVHTGHGWAGPRWDVNKYRFGASDLFDDYDFGADCTLHNESLSNEQVFRKGVSLFQKVIAYAHRRGVRIGLGLDINLIPPEYKADAADPAVVKARAEQIIRDYPNLDYLLCFQSEGIGRNAKAYAQWRGIFDGFYRRLKTQAPQTRLAVSGWGLDPQSIAALPKEVICAPISAYSDGCVTGAEYGDREYWGCPWLERDGDSSEHYYPYNLHLSNTIKAWQNRAPNMKGFYCLTWRLTDAIDAKMSYMSKVPWDTAGKYATSEAAYRDYAERNYGRDAAESLTAIINQNEPFASNEGECEGTHPFEDSYSSGWMLNVKSFTIGGRTTDAAKPASRQGTQNAPCSEGGECVGFISAGNWLRFDDVDFGPIADRFEARVASAASGGQIELRLDSPEGKLLADCRVDNTGDWQKWTTRQVAMVPTGGKHTVCLVFRGTSFGKRELAKANQQLAVIDRCLVSALPAQQARLQLLRSRIAAAKSHIELNLSFKKYAWSDLPGPMDLWVGDFTHRVNDISSLGNVTSIENRQVQLNYVAREEALRKSLPVQPPEVTARGTHTGAVVTWTNREPGAAGFHVYRDGNRLNKSAVPAGHEGQAYVFTDQGSGKFRYAVTAVSGSDVESLPSVPVTCLAGAADAVAPYLAVISPPCSVAPGQDAAIKVRVLDGRTYDSISATLSYRTLGATQWKSLSMTRKVKAIFTARIPADAIAAAGVEYYIEATDGDNAARFPASAPTVNATILVESRQNAAAPSTPKTIRAVGRRLSWTPAEGDVHWYRIYRGSSAEFQPGPENFLTYVPKEVTEFQDNGPGSDGQPLKAPRWYRVSAVDTDDNESPATQAVGAP